MKKNGAKQKLNAEVVATYTKADAKYRRIDTDWLGSAENLALKIDGDVNNTSLALGLELAVGACCCSPAMRKSATGYPGRPDLSGRQFEGRSQTEN